MWSDIRRSLESKRSREIKRSFTRKLQIRRWLSRNDVRDFLCSQIRLTSHMYSEITREKHYSSFPFCDVVSNLIIQGAAVHIWDYINCGMKWIDVFRWKHGVRSPNAQS